MPSLSVWDLARGLPDVWRQISWATDIRATDPNSELTLLLLKHLSSKWFVVHTSGEIKNLKICAKQRGHAGGGLALSPVSTGMGDGVRVRLPEAALYFSM